MALKKLNFTLGITVYTVSAHAECSTQANSEDLRSQKEALSRAEDASSGRRYASRAARLRPDASPEVRYDALRCF